MIRKQKFSGIRFALIFGLLCAAAFVLIAVLVGANLTSAVDLAIIDVLQSLETDGWTGFAQAVSAIVSGIPLAVIIVIVVLLLILRGRRWGELALFLAALAGSQVLNLLLKPLFGRERPDLHRLIEEDGFGFPSGNAMSAMALFGILIFLLWRHIPSKAGRIVLVIVGACFILIAGASRVYMGVHYPSDIAAGYMASGFWLSCCLYVYLALRNRK